MLAVCRDGVVAQFETSPEATKLRPEQATKGHHLVAKALFLCKRARHTASKSCVRQQSGKERDINKSTECTQQFPVVQYPESFTGPSFNIEMAVIYPQKFIILSYYIKHKNRIENKDNQWIGMYDTVVVQYMATIQQLCWGVVEMACQASSGEQTQPSHDHSKA